VHYRPLAKLTPAEYATAWELTQKLTGAVVKPDFRTVKRREHGLGLEVHALASEAERQTLRTLTLAQTRFPGRESRRSSCSTRPHRGGALFIG